MGRKESSIDPNVSSNDLSSPSCYDLHSLTNMINKSLHVTGLNSSSSSPTQQDFIQSSLFPIPEHQETRNLLSASLSLPITSCPASMSSLTRKGPSSMKLRTSLPRKHKTQKRMDLQRILSLPSASPQTSTRILTVTSATEASPRHNDPFNSYAESCRNRMNQSIDSRMNHTNPFLLLHRAAMAQPIPEHIENMIMKKEERRKRKERENDKDMNMNPLSKSHPHSPPPPHQDMEHKITPRQIDFLQRLRVLASSSFED